MSVRSLRLRLLMLGGVTVSLALLIAGLGIVWLFERHAERRAEAELDTYIRQISAGISFRADGSTAFTHALADPRFASPLSGLYWQINDEGKGHVLRSRSLWDFVLKLPPDVLNAGEVHRHVLEGPSSTTLLTRERSIAYSAPAGLRRLRIAVALDMRELQAASAKFSWDVLVALALLGAALLAAAWAQIAIGLKPLKALRQGVLAVRSGVKSRIDVSGPREVMPLVAAVNSLLEAQAKTLESAKARAADLAHGLKTPLTVLMADAAKLRDGGAAEVAAEIEELATVMQRYIDRELSRVRLQSIDALKPARTPVEPVLAKLVRTLGRTPKGEALQWRVRVSGDIAVPMQEDDLAELLGNLLDNACKWAESAVCISSGSDDAGITIAVEDDGPGAPAPLIHRLGERGLRLDRQVPGSGFGLAIAHDIVKAYGGSLTFGNAEPHGFRTAVFFPRQGAARSGRPRCREPDQAKKAAG